MIFSPFSRIRGFWCGWDDFNWRLPPPSHPCRARGPAASETQQPRRPWLKSTGFRSVVLWNFDMRWVKITEDFWPKNNILKGNHHILWIGIMTGTLVFKSDKKSIFIVRNYLNLFENNFHLNCLLLTFFVRFDFWNILIF